MKKFFEKTKVLSVKIAATPFKNMVIVLLVIAFVMNVIIETLARASLIEVIVHIFTSPIAFFVNFIIIFFTLCPCLLIKKRIPLLVFTVAVWVGIGIGNAVLLSNRASPLSAIDFLVLKSAFTMLPIYFSIIQIVCIVASIAGALALVVFLFIKFPRSKVSLCKSLICIGITFVTIWLGATIIYADLKNSDSGSADLSAIYEKYGFTYCFSRSIFAHGVDKPQDYTSDRVDEIVDVIAGDNRGESLDDMVSSVKPNIIYIQLESFFDPLHVKGLEYSTEPTPNFNRLKENGVSGYVRMANVGGGTANTEFEILTGMNLDHFGFGEYPYTTALRTSACESMAANLKEVGYSTHAMHNHIADFYDRDSAYAHLGFDTFTPIEMMRNIVRNPLGWAKDEMLTSEIISALDSTDSRDFIFAVSVQAHGKYPEDQMEDSDGGYENLGEFIDGNHKNYIEVFGATDEYTYNRFTYYVNQVYEMDMFIGELIGELEKRGEECVVVFYGDHLPALSLTDGDIANGDIYQTEYAVWSNYPIAGSLPSDDLNAFDRDMEAYELSAYIQKICGMSIGNITKLHQSQLLNSEDKDEYLQMLEYSQLYDKDSTEYLPTDMKWGTRPIILSSYRIVENSLYVSGEGFNQYSSVIVDGFKKNTVYINEYTLMVENIFSSVDTVEVVQTAAGIGEIYKATLNTKNN